MRLDHLLSKEDTKVNHALSKVVDSGSCSILRVPERHIEKGKRGFSSAGRAPALQAGGQGFDSLNLHQTQRRHRIRIGCGGNEKEVPRSREKDLSE